MFLRASLAFALALASACGGHAAGKLVVDSPALTFQAPDIDEISGVDSEESEAPPKEDTKPAPAPAPAPAPKK